MEKVTKKQKIGIKSVVDAVGNAIETPEAVETNLRLPEYAKDFSGGFLRLSTVVVKDVERATGYKTSIQLKICGTITGCGLCQIQGISQLVNTDECRKAFKDAMLQFIKNLGTSHRPACIIATLGYSLVTVKGFIGTFGFKEVVTYKNWAHGKKTTDNQTLYYLELDETYFENAEGY